MKKICCAYIFVTFATSVGIGACRNADKASFPYKVQVLAFDSVDPETDKTRYKLTTKKFTTLKDLDALNGDYLKIIQGGNLKIKATHGSLIEGEKFTDGHTPKLRYKVSNGVVIPKDYSTLAMLSAYYQFDVVFSELQQRLGVTVSDVFKSSSKTKLEALFEPKISIETDSSDTDAMMKGGAAFDPKSWQFILYRRSAIERVPTMTNLQVISHEFGHVVFQRYFYDGLFDKKNRFHSEYALRGLNEGFADFISYIYTGSGDILRASLSFSHPEYKKNVATYRSFKKYRFSYATFVSDENSLPTGAQGPTCGGEFYCIGSIFARGLYDASEQLAASGTLTREQFAPSLIAALPGVLDDIENEPIPDDTPLRVSEHSGTFDRWVISQFLNGLIKRMPTATQTTLCTVFTDENSFGEIGYPASLRKICGAP